MLAFPEMNGSVQYVILLPATQTKRYQAPTPRCRPILPSNRHKGGAVQLSDRSESIHHDRVGFEVSVNSAGAAGSDVESCEIGSRNGDSA